MVAIQDIVRVGDEGYSLWCVEKLVEYRDEPAAVLWRYDELSISRIVMPLRLLHTDREATKAYLVVRQERNRVIRARKALWREEKARKKAKRLSGPKPGSSSTVGAPDNPATR